MITKIEESGFAIIQMLKKELTKQEVINLYYKHTEKDFFDNMVKYLMNGESVILLLTCEEDDPIKKWKSFIGQPDPVEAKVYRNSLREISSFFNVESSARINKRIVWNKLNEERCTWK